MEEKITDFLVNKLPKIDFTDPYYKEILLEVENLQKNKIDNKVIHFAEWLTKKHTLTLMDLYKHFEELYYETNNNL